MITTKLSVNINKVATIRNARGGDMPHVIDFAKNCMRYGADGITVHPRPDERHITRKDIAALSELVPTNTCEFNIEGYPSDDFLNLIRSTRATQVTLVPDAPNVLTSHEGWDTIFHEDLLKKVIEFLRNQKIRISLFMDTDLTMLDKAKELGVERVEFYTGQYANQYSNNREEAVAPFLKAASHCQNIGLGINAGHDLNLENLAYFKSNIIHLEEVSIGHALISDCLYYGLQNTIPMYKRLL